MNKTRWIMHKVRRLIMRWWNEVVPMMWWLRRGWVEDDEALNRVCACFFLDLSSSVLHSSSSFSSYSVELANERREVEAFVLNSVRASIWILKRPLEELWVREMGEEWFWQSGFRFLIPLCANLSFYLYENEWGNCDANTCEERGWMRNHMWEKKSCATSVIEVSILSIVQVWSPLLI